jgi:hypothetical protein
MTLKSFDRRTNSDKMQYFDSAARERRAHLRFDRDNGRPLLQYRFSVRSARRQIALMALAGKRLPDRIGRRAGAARVRATQAFVAAAAVHKFL